jgi:hypothetical protein
MFQRKDGTARIRYLDSLRGNTVEADKGDDSLFIAALIEGLKKTEEREPGTTSLHVLRCEQVWSSKDMDIELLYNEHYEVDSDGREKGPLFDVASIEVEPQRARLVIKLPAFGHIVMTRDGWETLVQQVNHAFQEEEDNGKSD